MTTTAMLKKTPLHSQHVDAGGRMVDFAGWHLPVQFSGVMDEHRCVRERVGLFDVSHMGEVAVEGPGALEFLQHVTCNDVARLASGQAQYTALTTTTGTIVDDLLIYRLDAEAFLLVVNAANAQKDFDWLGRHANEFDLTRLEDHSSRWAQIAVQGPAASLTVAPLAEIDVNSIRYYRFAVTTLAGAECILSRTGYTGELGYEIYAPAAAAPAIWDALLECGEAHGISRIGLGARDTLRLEAGLALYGNDIDDTTTVVEAGLGWIVKADKGEFLGRELLVRQMERGTDRRLVGFEMRGRGIARQGYRVVVDGVEAGRVTSGTRSPTLEKNIGLAYVPTAHAEIGSEIAIEIRDREEIAVVIPTPFYRRPGPGKGHGV